MIKTFVFFDIETTGLIKKDRMPRITELSFIAVTRDNMCLKKNKLPRVLQTLTVPINPNETIPPKVENLTELKNEYLQNVSSFDSKIYDLIHHFLDTLTVPICFVAHNGYQFDYPIFLWELQCLNKNLDPNVLCVDTLPLFKNFFMNNEKILIQHTKNLKLLPSHSFNQDDNSKTFLHKNGTKKEHAIQQELVEISSNSTKDPTYQGPSNFKLSTIYKYLLNVSPDNAHTAQSDCITMLHCANHLGDFFLTWCDCNAVPLIEKKNY